jgi:hypothetical protein
MKKIFAIFILCLTPCTILRAQSSLNSAGTDVINTSGTVSYSIGQIFYEQDSTIFQGVHHTYHLLPTLTMPEAESINIGIYPNPVKDVLTLHFAYNIKPNCKYVLCDINGKILYQQPLKNSETKIDLSNLSTGSFFLQIISQEKIIKVFKIVKS